MIDKEIEKSNILYDEMLYLSEQVKCDKVDETDYAFYCSKKMSEIMESITSDKNRNEYLEFLKRYIAGFERSNEECRDFYMLSLSVLLAETGETKYIDKICEEIHNEYWGPHAGLFVFNQIKRLSVKNKIKGGLNKAEDLYWEMVGAWSDVLADKLTPIPKEERNKDRVVVIILHILNKSLAPTKTAVERVNTLQEMGKEVLCIHSREQYTSVGAIPFYNTIVSSFDERFNGTKILNFDGCKFRMYQPDKVMPEYFEMIKIIDMIRDFSPYEIVVLGDNCLLGDVCSQMIPTVCIPMLFSSMPRKRTSEYVAVGKPVLKEEIDNIVENGYNPEQFIESTFTFELIEQKKQLTRKELDLPEDKFIISIVGIRLDFDVSEEFIVKVLELFKHDIHIAFAGTYNNYKEVCNKYPELKDNSTFVGYQNDILAFQEVCDLYVNPPRYGGGFSVVEAFYKHKPGVTLGYGDVAASAGREFWVDNLDEMIKTIIKYKEEKEFYDKMADVAYLRSLDLFDSKKALKHILDEVENRSLFF